MRFAQSNLVWIAICLVILKFKMSVADAENTIQPISASSMDETVNSLNVGTEGDTCALDVYGNSSITDICHESLECMFDTNYNYPTGKCSQRKFNKFDNMYCVPPNPSDSIDFGTMILSDFENVKFRCASMKTCKAFYEASQDGKKSYFGCKNTYDKKASSNNNISHILYVKGPPESPRDLGCWIYLPSKCPKQSNFKRDFKYWFSDGLYDKDSATNRDRCEIHRRQHWNTWCGVEDTFTKYIDVPHYFTSNLRNITGVEDGRVEFQLECEKDTAKVTWFINGTEIKPDGTRIQVFADGNNRRLLITKANIGDTGKIQAKTNSDERSCYLEVKSPPPAPETPGCWIYLPNECPVDSENQIFPPGTDFSKWIPLITPENKEKSCENKTKEYQSKCEDAGALFKFVVKYRKIKRATLCSDLNLDEIKTAAQCRDAGEQLGLIWQGMLEGFDGKDDFPGCIQLEDGRNYVYFNINPKAGSANLMKTYAAICIIPYVNCGTLGKAEKCQKCPRLYGKESCTGGDCGYLNDTCVKKECIHVAEPITQRMKEDEMKPDLLIKYNATPYYHYNKVDGSMKKIAEKPELYFISTKKGETFSEMLNPFSNKLTFNQYQLDDEYKITSNMHVCNQTLSFRTSFALEICYHKNSSQAILYENVCDRYNDCDQCDCGCPSCDCTKGDESETMCKGKVRTAFWISLAYYIVMMILGCLSFVLVKSYTTKENMMDENTTNEKVDEEYNVKILIDESTPHSNERNTIQKEIIEKLSKIVKEEDGLEKQFVLDNLSNFRDLNKKIGNINCKSSSYLNILKVTYTLSHNQRYQRECNKIVHMLYINEYEVHKNRAKALKCLIGSKEELSYLSAWIYKVVDQNGVFDVGNEPSKFSRLITQLPFYALPMFSTGMFYLDITKDIATTYFFFHIFANILNSVYYESRYESVGELNFERLFYYHLAIIITSEVLIYLRVLSKGCFEKGGKDELHKIFNTKNTAWRFLVYIFPIHFCLLEQGYLNYKVFEAQQYIERIDQDKKKNDNVSREIMKTSRKLEIFNQRLHYINQLYAEIDIIETCFERSPQLVVQTVLFIIANYYSRVLYLFDELLFIPINYVFVLNWFSTVYSISNSILCFRNAKRFPLSTTITGTILQKAAMFIWISGKIVFISVALSNMPYLHPIGPILEIIFVFFIHVLVSRCMPTHSLYTTVGIATTSAFYRPPTRTTKTLSRKKPLSPDSDQDLLDEEANSEQSTASSCCGKNKPNSCSKILEPYMSLRRNGGILSTIMLEALSIAIYFGIGKLVRHLRRQEIQGYETKIRDQMNEKNKEQDIFRHWFELVFVNVSLTSIAVVIAVLFGLFALYLGIVYLYYKFGHPKHLIINKLIEDEPEEKIVSNLWEHLDLSPPNNKDKKSTTEEIKHLNA